VIAWLREHEDDLLADLRAHHARAEQEYRDALAAAKEKYATVARAPKLGQWLQANCDDVGFGRQPVPPVVNAEDVLHPNVVRESLQRHWAKPKPWLPDPEDVAARQRGLAQKAEMAADPARDALAVEDGEVAVIEPLDEATRFGSAA
jgi:hypothetical protein